MMRFYVLLFCSGILLSVFGLNEYALAETQDIVTGAPATVAIPAQGAVVPAEDPPPVRFESPYEAYSETLFFTAEDIIRIRVALAGHGADVLPGDDPNAGPPPSRRIRVSGIAYSGPSDWMVWINGARVTPQNRLPEIIDITVYKNYIDLKWFDFGLRKIIKIRMRANQVYDIPSGVMLPG